MIRMVFRSNSMIVVSLDPLGMMHSRAPFPAPEASHELLLPQMFGLLGSPKPRIRKPSTLVKFGF